MRPNIEYEGEGKCKNAKLIFARGGSILQRRSRFVGNQITLLRILSNACLFSGIKFFIVLFYVFGFLFAQLSTCLRPAAAAAPGSLRWTNMSVLSLLRSPVAFELAGSM